MHYNIFLTTHCAVAVQSEYHVGFYNIVFILYVVFSIIDHNKTYIDTLRLDFI